MLRAEGPVVRGLIAMALGLLAACALPPNDGFTQTRSDAMPYVQAHALCNERGMGAPAGGPGEGSARQRIHLACMAEMGWEDRRGL